MILLLVGLAQAAPDLWVPADEIAALKGKPKKAMKRAEESRLLLQSASGDPAIEAAAKQLLTDLQEAVGPEHISMLPPLLTLADALAAQDRYAEAIAVQRKAANLASRRPDLHAMECRSASRLASWYDTSGDIDKALSTQERFIDRCHDATTTVQMRAADQLRRAWLLDRKGDRAAALAAFEAVVELWEKAEVKDAAIAEPLLWLGNHYQAAGEPRMARSAFERALEALEWAWGPDDIRVLPALQDLVELFEKEGMAVQATPYKTRMSKILGAE